jgi:regulator of sigma E protease
MTTLFAFLLALGVLVSFHEYGHYFAAVRSGVKVLRFSLGFGPVLWSRRLGRDQTEWVLSLIPLGGYVKMLDEREAPVAEEDRHRAFNRQSLGTRALIVAAGPVFNLALAVFLFAFVGMIGVPGIKPYVNAPEAGSPAALAGIESGDLVLAVNGVRVEDWQDLRLKLAARMISEAPVTLSLEKASGAHVEVTLGAVAPLSETDPLMGSGLHVWSPRVDARLGHLLSGGAANRQGLREGDLVIEADQQKVSDWLDFVHAVRRHPGTSMPIVVLRQDQRLAMTITPDAEEEGRERVGKLGVAVAVDPAVQQKLRVLVRHGPLESLRDGVEKTWQLSSMTLTVMARMVTGATSTQTIGGPLQIAAAAGDSVRMGWVPYLGFLAFLSVSLGVLNLLPVPVLDGGHLLYYSFELVTGRPVPDRWADVGTRVGLFLLLALMALAFYNDINRFISG